jgi:hypothetical protein
VKRLPAGAVQDLLAAREAVRDEERRLGLGAYSGEQRVLADLHRDIVVLALEAE